MLTGGLCLWAVLLWANNLQLSPVQYLGNGKIRFSISWDNSWNLPASSAPGNHDAVWVFVKFNIARNGYIHGNLDTTLAAHQVTGNLRVQPSKDGAGAWIIRTDTASGSISTSEVTLQVNIEQLPENQYTIAVYGLEMVYVNPGAFYLGDGKSINRYRTAGGAPLLIQNENQIDTGSGPGQLAKTEDHSLEGPVPASFPKGTKGFYIMKYELSQGAWVAFMNSLHLKQQQAHAQNNLSSPPGTPVLYNGTSFRNGVVIAQSAQTPQAAILACNQNGNQVYNEPEDGWDLPCNFLNWTDILAWTDWAGLRPMTDFEFEKACRGPLAPVEQEMAWGTAYATDAATLQQSGTAAEGVSEIGNDSTGLCNFGYTGVLGPIRTGFAATAISDRVSAGAAYYGAFEMSGNLWEPCIVAQGQGRSYTGQHGDGQITHEGTANTSDWPLTDGQGIKGGGFYSGISSTYRDPAISDRWYAYFTLDMRRNTTGCRAIRTSE